MILILNKAMKFIVRLKYFKVQLMREKVVIINNRINRVFNKVLNMCQDRFSRRLRQRRKE
jgi:hypothetical protein